MSNHNSFSYIGNNILDTFGSFCGYSADIKIIKNNKQILLQLYPIDEFYKLQNIPDNKFIIFADENGVVLGSTEFIKEAKNFTYSIKSFSEYKDIYLTKSMC